MRLFNAPLYWRLLGWICVANLLALLLGGLLAHRFIAYSAAGKVDGAQLAQDADLAYETGGQRGLAGWVAQQRRKGVIATLFQDGEPLYPMPMGPRLQARLPAWLVSTHDVALRLGPGSYVFVQAVTARDGQVRKLLAISHSHLRVHPRVRETIYLATQLLLSLLLVGALGWRVARRFTQPIEALRRATRHMATGELSVRVGGHSDDAHDELTLLARDFDVMAERIEALVAHERSALQDLSHELRSPLARLELIVDLARHSASPDDASRYFEQAEREIARLDQMLDDILTLWRIQTGLPDLPRQPVELRALTQRCLQQARYEADARHVKLELSGVTSATVTGNAALLGRALDNLVANAIKFSPEGGEVQLFLTVDAGHAELALRDHGPGVPPNELGRLFQPFFRGSNAARAEGHGLGLSIVQRVVEAHHGSVDASNAAGGGLKIRLRLPLAARGAV